MIFYYKNFNLQREHMFYEKLTTLLSEEYGNHLPRQESVNIY